jgi:hypothetical protein
MKFAAVTLLFATLVAANPAPIAQPEAVAAPAPIAEPAAVPEAIVEARVAKPKIDAIAAGIQLDSRAPKKSKPKGSSGNSTEGAAGIITPSRALQAGALGLGVMEVVRLWT